MINIMKEKLIIAIISLTILMAKNDTLKIDIENSQILWDGNSLKGGHNGSVKSFSGFIIKDKNKILKGEVIVNMKSLDNEDIKNVKMKKKLIKVLQSSDFFDSENYPKTKFTFEEVKITNEGTYLIGQMRIKGKVVKEEIKLESIDNNSASGKFSINRSKYDIYPGFFMNLVIDKQFDIDFKIIIK